DADAATTTRYSGAGQVPPVAAGTGASTTAAPSASERAYGTQAGGPEIAATDQAMGKHMTENMGRANMLPGAGGQYDVHHGIHYSYNYEYECQQSGQPQLWKDQYRQGHTEAPGFIQPYESNNWMDWELKKGQSASKGIKDWLKGATVAECLSSVIAMEIDTLRASIGDKKFDQMFGSADPKEDAAVTHRMHVSWQMGQTPVANFMKATELAQTANKNGGQFGTVTPAEMDAELKPGQWYYFYNHPMYLLKHPGGAWQGENALYMGKNEAGERVWSGLGATKTEDAMVDEMVSAYNADRDKEDQRQMKESKILKDDGTYADPTYNPAAGKFPPKVTKKQILESQVFQIGNTQRKGGFMATAGQELDAKKVEQTRDQ
ncbi:MAG TPA: hypothetical protein VGF94_07500, partial [Kofleriaceae bacterium]